MPEQHFFGTSAAKNTIEAGINFSLLDTLPDTHRGQCCRLVGGHVKDTAKTSPAGRDYFAEAIKLASQIPDVDSAGSAIKGLHPPGRALITVLKTDSGSAFVPKAPLTGTQPTGRNVGANARFKDSFLDIGPEQAERRVAVSSEQAKNKLAQEALLADPHEMRRLFPQVLRDASLNHNGHLDIAEIEAGLANQKIPQDEKNLLQLFKKDFDLFIEDGTRTNHADGISEHTMEVLEKAVDRHTPGDPVYHSAAMTALWSGPLLGVMAELKYGEGKDPRARLIEGGLLALGGLALAEGAMAFSKWSGGYDEAYDEIKADYKRFSTNFHDSKPDPPTAGSGGGW